MDQQQPKIKIKVKPLYYVGGHPFRVVLSNKLRDIGNDGRITQDKQVIEINPKSPESRLSGALIHEFIHAVNCVYCNWRLSEDDVKNLSEGLNQIFSQMDVELDWSMIKEDK